MLTLFNKYKDSGKITEALLIGRNLFNKQSSNREVFNAYFEFLCSLAESLPSIDDRKSFAGQADVVLAFYSENAELYDEIITEIDNYQQKLNDILFAINEVEALRDQEYVKGIQKNNDKLLKQLLEQKEKLYNISTQEQFDKTLSEIRHIDEQLNNDLFNDDQENLYETLTKEHTELINKKMREIEYKKNIEYNKKAVESFSVAFKQFKNDEGKYKNQIQLFQLVSKTLFAYDAARLTNETLIYYNHIYSYIFSKLDDDGKRSLTKYSIECERKLR